jgi:prepilin-type N-terminal cleavage/methylation domain-containing protein
MMMIRNRCLDRVEQGFTLIELLVVIGILGILAGLLIPALLFGKFKARVTTCTNNYKQLALAAVMYAGDDSMGRLPSFELPTESTQLKGFHNLYPWIIGLPTLKAMETHGIAQPQMWFCPLQNVWQESSATFQWKFGRPMATIDDFIKFFTDIQKGKYASLDLNWWVPRRLEGSPTLTYPDASLLSTRLKTPWPSKMDDLTISTRPILSDWMVGSKEASGDSFTSASGAHAFAGRIRNGNSAYADGHMVTHSASSMKWELELTASDGYIFY